MERDLQSLTEEELVQIIDDESGSKDALFEPRELFLEE